jgi:hypothetical protein
MVKALPMPALLIRIEGDPQSERIAWAALRMSLCEVMSHR